jgi:hypothetical protein
MSNTHNKITGYALQLANSFGFLYCGELFLIQALVQSLPDHAVVVQIGAGVGTGSLGMVEMNPTIRAYTVDICEGGPLGGLQNERNAFNGTGLPCPTQILGNSQEVWKDWNNGLIDLLFIDADHDLPGVELDTLGWTPLVKVGGYALFHDYSSNNWPKVADTVDKYMIAPEWQEVLTVDTIKAFRRCEVIEEACSVPVSPAIVKRHRKAHK